MNTDQRKSKLILPEEIKAYKLNIIKKDRHYALEPGYDIYKLKNVNTFRRKFYPITLNRQEIKAINEGKLGNILKLYILIKSMTNNGRFGILISHEYLKTKIGYKYYNNLHLGLEYGVFSAYKLRDILFWRAPRTVIYVNEWWDKKG